MLNSVIISDNHCTTTYIFSIPRCGLKDPNGTVAQDNFCFCDDPLDQPGITYMYNMMISNNVWANPWPGPWQWTADNTTGRSSLLDPANQNYMRLKKMIEEAVRKEHENIKACCTVQ